MHQTLLSLALSGLGRDAFQAVAGFAAAVLIALAFAISSVIVLFAAAVPADGMAGTRVGVDRAHPGTPQRAVAIARSQTGRPYVWGGASPQTSFDCSGLVVWAYGQAGVDVPRTAQQQFEATVRLPRQELKPGDLVFFRNTYPTPPSEPITHVGIYVGNGRMINAPTEGDVIREMPVFTGFWARHYAGAGRVRQQP